MALINKEDLDFLKNEAETIVLGELERQLKNFPEQICTCKECLLDMLTLALNSIKPLYRVTLMGKIYTGMAMNEKAYATSVRESVFKAVEKVYKNPSHLSRGEEGENVEEGEKKSQVHFKQAKQSKGSTKK